MMNEEITKIQIFGERCSGTNYTKQLLVNNFPDIELTAMYGFKHRFHNKNLADRDNCLFLIVYRDLFDWLRSFHLQPFHAAPELCGIPFSQFIRKEWRALYTKSSGRTPDDPLWGTEMMFERDPQTGNRFRNVLELRRARTCDWESLGEKVPYFLHLCYEDLRNNPEGILREISEQFGLVRKKKFMGVSSYKGKQRVSYIPKKYQAISPEDRDYILRESDLQQEQSIGYNIPQRKLQIEMEWLESQLNEKDRCIEEQELFMKSLVNSNSFRLGRFITWPIRKICGRKHDIRLQQLFSKK